MLYELAYKLNEELLKDDLILNVKDKENIMNNNEEFMKLVIYYDSLKSKIEDLEKYGIDAKEKQKELYKIKYKLDTLEVVKDYRLAYKKAKEYLDKISKEVFKNIDDELKINSIWQE